MDQNNKMNIDAFLNYLLLITHCKLTNLLIQMKTLTKTYKVNLKLQ